MAQSYPILTRRACVLFKIESTTGVDAGPTQSADAVLVSDPSYTIDPVTLERNFVRNDLSPLGVAIGRKLAGMKFSVELRSNDLTDVGTLGSVSKLGRMLRACGYSETAVNAAATPGAVVDVGVHTAAVTWAVSGTNANKDYYDFEVVCVKAGASGTAKVRVNEINGYQSGLLKNKVIRITTTSASGTLAVDQTDPLLPTITVGGTWVAGEKIHFNVNGFVGRVVVGATPTPTSVGTALAAAITALNADLGAASDTGVVTLTYANDMTGTVVTSATTAVDLGDCGVTVTPTWTGSLALGQTWKIRVSPTGIRYAPVSDGFESATLYMYLDGTLHKMTAAQGTFSIKAQAGQFGMVDFTFTGQYVDPIDAEMPANPIYETTKPPVFELAKLRVDSEDITVDNFSFDQNNTISPRVDANNSDGYSGTRVTARAPKGGVDPEATKMGDYNFYAKMAAASSMLMSCRFGKNNGNIIWVKAPKVQYSGLTYKDRDGIRVYDVGLSFGRDQGNDEVEFFFA